MSIKTHKNNKENDITALNEEASRTVIEDSEALASIPITQLMSGNNDSNVLDKSVISESIIEQEKLLAKGDISSLENMLLSQTHVLNTLFNVMTSKMATSQYIEHLDTYGRLALKAQNQTRQTITTLGELKGIKKTTFIKQHNQAINQQINNSEKLDSQSNELGHEHVDGRSQTTRAGQNKPNSTLEEINRTKNNSRQTALEQKQPQTWDAICEDERIRETVGRTEQTATRGKKTD